MKELPGWRFLLVALLATLGMLALAACEEEEAEWPLANLDVRLALARAIDRDELVRVVYGNAHLPTTSWVPEADNGPAPDVFEDIIGFDPDAARAHLEAAGYPNGEGFPRLTILVRDSPQRIAEAEFLQDAWREVLNIDTEIEIVDGPTRSARYTDQQFELFPGGWIHDYPDIENWIIAQWETGATLNNTNCSVPEIDDLAAQARFNPNNEERIQQYLDINRLIVENACHAPFYHEANLYLIKPFVVGMKENVTGQDGLAPADWAAEYWGRSDGGTTITVQDIEPAALDPHFSSFSQDIGLQRKLWRGLYTLDINNVPQPAMAAALPEISADGKTYTVRLKEGLKWSDGDDLLAEDFVMGIKRTCNPEIAGEYEYVVDAVIVGCTDYFNAFGTAEAPQEPTAEELQALEDAVGVRAVDNLTIEYQLTDATPTFTIFLSMWMTFPVPVHLFPEPNSPWPAPSADAPGQLAYNGPYILTEYQPGDHLTLAPNPNWAAPAGVTPTLERIVARFIDDYAVADNAYRAGELDAALVDETQLAVIESEFGPTGEYLKVIVPVTWGLYMQQVPPQ